MIKRQFGMNPKSLRPKLMYAVNPPLSITGGVSVLAQILIKEFSKTYEVYLLSADSSDFLATDEIGGFLAGHLEWKPSLGPPRLSFLRYVRGVATQIVGMRIDLVHFHSGFFNFGNRFIGFSLSRQLRKRGIPSIWTTHGIFSLIKGYCGPKKPLWLKLLMFPSGWLGKFNQLQNTECEIHVSQFDLRTVRRVWFPLRGKCSHIYHSKIDIDDEERATRKRIILNVGYISFNKRQDLLVRAFMELSGKYAAWELYFIGHDSPDGCREYIERLIGSSPARSKIHFLGSRNDVGSFMKSCGIYVTGSDFEGLPLAPQEAMHYGCPVIASDIPAHQELFATPGSGLLFRHGNAADLVVQLNLLMEDDDLRENLGRRARASVLERGMTRAAMLEKHAAMYQSVLNNKP